MLFSSTIFLFAFLPLTLLFYFISPIKWRNYILLLVSLVFYAWGEPKFIFVMISSIIVNYILGLLIDYYRNDTFKMIFFLILTVLSNIGIMFVFKYLNFALSNLDKIFGDIFPQTEIPLPIGISFFTFQALSYVIDVYRNQVKVQKNIFYLALYISFFPQLIAGPIVRYSTIEEEIRTRIVTPDGFSIGVKRFIIGLCKKVLLANNVALLADKAFALEPYGELSVSLAWLGAIAYAFQIYFDFSGYSDMAIGLGRMFGFNFLENFNFPYMASTITDFWRRWHISLSSWFRDYIYFPMGGSRVNTMVKHIRNLFVVWLLTGIWHGASWNFITWGLVYFLILVLEKFVIKPETMKPKVKGLYRLFTLVYVLLAWVLFRAKNLTLAVNYILSMFYLKGNAWTDDYTIFLLKENWIFLASSLLMSINFRRLLSRARTRKSPLYETARILYGPALLILLIVAVSFLVVGAHNPFIYFNF